MPFSAKKRPGRYIETPFKDYEVLDSDDLLPLIKRLKEGDNTAIKPIILGHVKIAVRIAGQYVRHPSSDQEMVSTAMEALIDGCYKILNGKKIDDNLTGYLISLIHSRCNRRSCEDHVIRIPVASLIKANKEGRLIIKPVIEELQPVVSRRVNLFDLKELIYSCCITASDQVIIRLREQYYSNVEISKLLSLSNVRVGQVVQEVEVRYKQKIKDMEHAKIRIPQSDIS